MFDKLKLQDFLRFFGILSKVIVDDGVEGPFSELDLNLPHFHAEANFWIHIPILFF